MASIRLPTRSIVRATSTIPSQALRISQYLSRSSAPRWHSSISQSLRPLGLYQVQRRHISDSSNSQNPHYESTIYDFEKIRSLPNTAPPSPSGATSVAAKRSPSTDSENASPILIDVREPHEYMEGRIPNTLVNVPVQSSPEAWFLSTEDFEDRFGTAMPGVEQPIVFYCKAGVRSKAAAQLAKQAGYKRVGEYPGSWQDWVKNGGEVER